MVMFELFEYVYFLKELLVPLFRKMHSMQEFKCNGGTFDACILCSIYAAGWATTEGIDYKVVVDMFACSGIFT